MSVDWLCCSISAVCSLVSLDQDFRRFPCRSSKLISLPTATTVPFCFFWGFVCLFQISHPRRKRIPRCFIIVVFQPIQVHRRYFAFRNFIRVGPGHFVLPKSSGHTSTQPSISPAAPASTSFLAFCASRAFRQPVNDSDITANSDRRADALI